MKKESILSCLIVLFSLSSPAQNALNFDGNSDYVQTSFPGILANNPRTIEFWVNGTGGVPNQIITTWGSELVNGGRYTVRLANGIPRIEVKGDGLTAKTNVKDGMWHHVAITYSQIGRNAFHIYVDGNLDTAGNIISIFSTQQNTNMRIGRRIAFGDYITGSLDEIRIWDYNRSQSEIIADMNREICSDSRLKAYYQFNQGNAFGSNTADSILVDNSGNGYNGSLISFALSGMTSNWASGKNVTPAGGVTTASISPTACNSYTSPSGRVYSQSGRYTDTIRNSKGCDSILTINVTISTVNLSITNSGNVLMSLEPQAAYQWLDCGNGYSIVPRETMQTFSPSANGNYAVELSKAGCVDTSGCISVTGLNVNDISNSQFVLYPNPNSGQFYIKTLEPGKDFQVRMTDAYGRKVAFKKSKYKGRNLIEIRNSNGIYFIELIVNDKKFSRKLLIY